MSTRPPTPLASDLMNRNVHTISPEMTLADVVGDLLKHGVSNAPVVEPQPGGPPRLLGFISERDCLEHLSNEMFYGSPAQPQTAATMMRRHPACVGPETDVFALASIFETHGYRHLPVVEEGRLLGIISRRDILRELDRFYRESLESGLQERFPPDLRQVAHLRFLVSQP